MRNAGFRVVVAVVALGALLSARADESARFYVYAQRPSAARSWLPISCDGGVVAKLRQGRFFVIDVAPGRHTFGEGHGIPVIVDARAGQESFVRLDWHYEGSAPPISLLQVIPADLAAREMINLTYIDGGKVLSRSVLKVDPRELKVGLKRRAGGDK